MKRPANAGLLHLRFLDWLWRNALAVGAPFDPGLRMRSPEPRLMRSLFARMLSQSPRFFVVFFAISGSCRSEAAFASIRVREFLDRLQFDRLVRRHNHLRDAVALGNLKGL